MNPIALFTMIATLISVTLITGYFFYKVLTTPHNPEPDSFIDNDDESPRKTV